MFFEMIWFVVHDGKGLICFE